MRLLKSLNIQANLITLCFELNLPLCHLSVAGLLEHGALYSLCLPKIFKKNRKHSLFTKQKDYTNMVIVQSFKFDI